MVMHYLEEEARLYLGQGRAAAGYPHPQDVQGRLQALLKVVAPHYKQLLQYSQDFEDVEAGYIVSIQGLEEAMVFHKNQQELQEMEAHALEALHAGDAVAGPMVPLEGKELMDWASDMVDKLTPGHQALVIKVNMTGVGKCPKCKYEAGCQNCD